MSLLEGYEDIFVNPMVDHAEEFASEIESEHEVAFESAEGKPDVELDESDLDFIMGHRDSDGNLDSDASFEDDLVEEALCEIFDAEFEQALEGYNTDIRKEYNSIAKDVKKLLNDAKAAKNRGDISAAKTSIKAATKKLEDYKQALVKASKDEGWDTAVLGYFCHGIRTTAKALLLLLPTLGIAAWVEAVKNCILQIGMIINWVNKVRGGEKLEAADFNLNTQYAIQGIDSLIKTCKRMENSIERTSPATEGYTGSNNADDLNVGTIAIEGLFKQKPYSEADAKKIITQYVRMLDGKFCEFVKDKKYITEYAKQKNSGDMSSVRTIAGLPLILGMSKGGNVTSFGYYVKVKDKKGNESIVLDWCAINNAEISINRELKKAEKANGSTATEGCKGKGAEEGCVEESYTPSADDAAIEAEIAALEAELLSGSQTEPTEDGNPVEPEDSAAPTEDDLDMNEDGLESAINSLYQSLGEN